MGTLTLLAVIAFGAVVARGAFPRDLDTALRSAKNLYVATRRADGTRSKVVPIWFMYDGEAVYFTTVPTSYKAKRIAKGSPLYVAVGSEDGPAFEGTAELLHDPDLAARMAPAYNEKYWIAWVGFFRPDPGRVRAGKTLLVKVTPRS